MSDRRQALLPWLLLRQARHAPPESAEAAATARPVGHLPDKLEAHRYGVEVKAFRCLPDKLETQRYGVYSKAFRCPPDKLETFRYGLYVKALRCLLQCFRLPEFANSSACGTRRHSPPVGTQGSGPLQPNDGWPARASGTPGSAIRPDTSKIGTGKLKRLVPEHFTAFPFCSGKRLG